MIHVPLWAQHVLAPCGAVTILVLAFRALARMQGYRALSMYARQGNAAERGE